MKTAFSLCIRYLVALVCLLPVHSLSIAQRPSARQVFQKMKETIDSIQTISYKLDYRNVNHGEEDSVFWSSSKTWVKRVPSDTIFAAHFHIRQTSKNGEADYYYDGLNAMDIYHKARHKPSEKTITVVEPFNLSNGFNSVQARTTARGFSTDILSQTVNSYWVKYLDSMQVKEEGDYWLLHWQQQIPADDFIANMEVRVNKTNFLIRHVRQHTRWHGVAMNQDIIVNDIRINELHDADSITLKQVYPDYALKYEKRRSNTGETKPFSLAGSKALNVRYSSFSGGTLTLLPVKGEYMLLDFWETWCGYCFAAMPKIKALHEKYASKGLKVVGVVTENKAQVLKIIEQQKFPYPTVFADDKLIAAYKLDARPRYLLIDSKGTIVADTSGDLEKIEQLLQEFFK